MPSMIPAPWVPITPEHFSLMWARFQERWQDRDDRFDLIDRVVRGDFSTAGPDGEDVETRSPNLIQVALEDTAEAASLIPSIRILPSKRSQEAKRHAEAMEKLGVSYFKASEIELLTIRSLLNLIGNGLAAWVCTYSADCGPRIEWRDPRTCFPEPDYSALGTTKRCFFARDVYVTQLPFEWQVKVAKHCADTEQSQQRFIDNAVTLVEYYDDERVTVAAVYTATPPYLNDGVYTTTSAVSIILEDYPQDIEMCPVISISRITFDGEPRGQFDQVIPVMLAHIRLMGIMLDYADQAVYSDVWVKDLIGHMPMGGGSYIQLGPQGDIGRVPPAVSSLSVFEELNQLVEGIHLGGRWPKTRPGDIDQAIASGKFVESTIGMMNTAIRTYHLLLGQAWVRALRVCFKMDRVRGKERTVSGVLRNQQFMLERNKDDIDLSAEINVEYGLGLGRDPAQSMVLAIQAQGQGFISKAFVQENFEGITDVGLERTRIDVEQLQNMAMAKLLQGLQEGSIPADALVKIAQARQKGEDMFDLYDKYVVKPQMAEEEAMLTSGLTGGLVPPGPDQGAGGPQAPVPPPAEALLGGLLGGGSPPETINRLSVPLGGGGFAGSQQSGGGPPRG